MHTCIGTTWESSKLWPWTHADTHTLSPRNSNRLHVELCGQVNHPITAAVEGRTPLHSVRLLSWESLRSGGRHTRWLQRTLKRFFFFQSIFKLFQFFFFDFGVTHKNCRPRQEVKDFRWVKNVVVYQWGQSRNRQSSVGILALCVRSGSLCLCFQFTKVVQSQAWYLLHV